MPDFSELRETGQRECDMLDHFRHVVASVGLTITGEKELPDGHGVQIKTAEGALPVYYHNTGCWNVQGKDATYWIQHLTGQIPELDKFPNLDGPRSSDSVGLRTGVLLHCGELREESAALSDFMHAAGLEPLNLQVPRQPWGPVLDSVEFYRQKARFGIIVATPGELCRFGPVYTGLPLLVGLLGPRNVVALVKADEYLTTKHVPSAVKVITFDEIDNDAQASVYRVLFNRAERPLRLHIRDHASDQFFKAYHSNAGKSA